MSDDSGGRDRKRVDPGDLLKVQPAGLANV